MATAGGIGQGLAAAVNGFMRGRQLAKDWADAEEDREWKNQMRDRQRKEWAAQDAEVDMLKSAGAKREVQEIPDAAGTQAYLKATEQGPAAETPQIDFTAPSGYAVATQPSADGKVSMKFDNVAQMHATRDAANTAVQQANTPQNMAQRMSEGYMRLGKPKEAMQIATNQLSLEEMQQKAADRVWIRSVGQAMVQGHEGLAALGSQAEYGPMKGMQVKAVRGDDGMVNYMRVGEDGQLSAIPGLPSFSNNQEGVIRAAAMLNHLTPPEERLKSLLLEKEAAQRQANWNATHNLAVRGADRADRAEDRAGRAEERQGRLTDAQIDNYRRRDNKPAPGVEMRVKAQQDELKEINKRILDAQANGTWEPESPMAKGWLKQRAALMDSINTALAPYTPGSESSYSTGYSPSGSGGAKPAPSGAGGKAATVTGPTNAAEGRMAADVAGLPKWTAATYASEADSIRRYLESSPNMPAHERKALLETLERMQSKASGSADPAPSSRPPAPARVVAAAPAAPPVNTATRAAAAPAAKAAPRDFYSGETAAKRHAEREKREAEEKKKDEEKRKRREAEMKSWMSAVGTVRANRENKASPAYPNIVSLQR